MKITYEIPDLDTGLIDFEAPYKVSTEREAARQCGENFHSEHDGWEGSWPLTFLVITPIGKQTGPWNVDIDREAVPEFVSSKIKPAKEGDDETEKTD